MTPARPAQPTTRHTVRMPLALLTLLALLLAGCATATTPLPGPTSAAAATSAAPSPSASTTPAACTNRLQSYAPAGALPAPGAMPSGSTMAKIVARGRLIVGVSADTYLFGARNPFSAQLEGFDIDIARSISAALFGSPDKIDYRVITASDRIPLLQKHEVDLVIRTFSITCDRWNQIAFSAEYYKAGQKVLVRRGANGKAEITSVLGLAGKKVCAPKGTTSLTLIAAKVPEATLVPADNHTGCLMLFQQGAVEAITGDDTVLAGLAAQDPYAVVLSGAALTEEPYGVGVAKDQVDLVRFVNQVLDQNRASGAWVASYNKWLSKALGAAPVPPVPQYGRTP